MQRVLHHSTRVMRETCSVSCLGRSMSYSAFRECLSSFVASVVEGQSAVMETVLRCRIQRSISE